MIFNHIYISHGYLASIFLFSRDCEDLIRDRIIGLPGESCLVSSLFDHHYVFNNDDHHGVNNDEKLDEDNELSVVGLLLQHTH